MSIISHIVNHLNSLIQCRTISVDLTSNILRQKIVEVHSYSLAYEIVQNWISHDYQRLPKILRIFTDNLSNRYSDCQILRNIYDQ